MKVPFKDLKISIKFKIAFFIVMLVIVMMGTVTYIFTIRELNLRVEQVKLRMERLANNIATIRSVETEDWDVYQTYIDNQLTLNPDIVYIAIFDERDELKAHALNIEWIDLGDRQTLNKREQALIVLQLDQRRIAEESQKDMEAKSVNIVIGGENLGMVKVGFSLVELNGEMRNNLYRNLNLAVIFIVLAVIVSFFMSQKIVNPLGKLTKAMLKISQDDLDQELHIDSRDEIGKMAETFNFMTKGLQEKALLENFSRELSFTFELEKIARLITERITVALNARRGFLFIRDQNKIFEHNLISSHPDSSKVVPKLIFDLSLYEFLLSDRNSKLLNHFSAHPEFLVQINKIEEISPHALIIPLNIQTGVIGLFLLDGNPKNVPYTKDEEKLLSTLIGQSSFAIENALLIEELTEQERLQRELEIARGIQKSLLPQQTPHIVGLDIDGICLPATEIGGDYYDYFVINDHTVGIAIADVTGKGTSAAFYMAVVKGMMLSLTSIHASPRKLMSDLNRRLYGVMGRNMFVTMSYAIVDTKKKNLSLARAGHNALIMQDSQKSIVERLAPGGIGLGLEKGNKFDRTIIERNIPFKTGDTFVFYTDGISEAMNDQKEEFGEERLLELVAKTDHHSAQQIRENIIDAVDHFVKDAPQYDDITMVILKAE
jgi:serine phosphatase RsbU (regulator of sigma subunit)/HAMP domain-containing protein